MVARTTLARRAISDMLASWSSPRAPTAASRMRAMLRSASARRRCRAPSAVWCGAGMVDLVHGDARSEAQLRQEARRRRQHEQSDDAGDSGDDAGHQERVAQTAGEAGGRARRPRADGAGSDGDEDGDAE